MPFRAVLVVGIAGVLALAFGAWLVYRRFIDYEPRAASHVLADADLVVRLDVEHVVLFEPVRRHLLPLANAALTSERSPAASGADRARALREVAGLNLGRDLREIVLSRSATGTWALALGGLFPDHGITGGVERVLRQEGVRTLERRDDVLSLAGEGVWIGQAPDGVIVVASSREALASALRGQADPAQLRVPTEGEAGVALGEDPVRRWLGASGTAAALAGFDGLYGRLQIERPLRLEVWPGRRDATTAQTLLEAAQRSVAFAAGSASAPTTDLGAERALVARARVEVLPPDDRATIVTSLELPELDAALAGIASRVERALAAGGPEG